MKVIRILGLVNGGKTPFDGKYLVHYDPSTAGFDDNGYPMTALIEASADPQYAARFKTADEAMEYWRMTSGRIREDGEPDRPLTAFTVEILEAPQRKEITL